MKKLGKFQMTSGKARVSDPCYDKDTWCAGTVSSVQNGSWIAHVVKKDCREWGERCSRLIAHFVDFPAPTKCDSKWKVQDIDVGVDSGQAGIFDETYFKDDEVVSQTGRIGNHSPICKEEPWYSICCDRTLNDVGAGVIPYGCVSSSGFGDGSYVCSVIKKGKKVVAIMIDFGVDKEE